MQQETPSDPIADVAEPIPPASLSPGQRRVVLGLVAKLMLVAAAVLPFDAISLELAFSHNRVGALGMLFCFGGLMTIPPLVTAWGTLADLPLVVRAPRTLGFIALLVLCFSAGVQFSPMSRPSSLPIFAWLAFSLFVAQAAIFGVLRRLLRWRLEWADQGDRPATATDSQFSVRQALIWTAGLAVLLALAKCVLPEARGLGLGDLVRATVGSTVSLVILFPTAVVALGWMLGESRRRALGVATVFLVLVTALVVLAFHASNLRISASAPWTTYLLIFCLPLGFQAGFLVVYLTTLGLFRHCGYRLVHRRPSPGARVPLLPGSSAEPPQNTASAKQWHTPGATGVSPVPSRREGALPEPGDTSALARCQWHPTRTSFASLVTALVLVNLGLILATVTLEATTRTAREQQRVNQHWMALGANAPVTNGQLRVIIFQRGAAISEEALQELRTLDDSDPAPPAQTQPAKTRFLQLSFNNTGLTDAQMPALEALPQLVDLDLRNTPVTAAGLKSLENMPQLQTLRLAGTRIDDACLAPLASLKQLRQLELTGTAVQDAGLLQLRSLSALSYLDLTGTAVTDAVLPELAQLPHLRQLHLVGTQVSDAGVRQLASWPQNLEVHVGPPVSRAAAKYLQQAPGKAVLYYPTGPGSPGEPP